MVIWEDSKTINLVISVMPNNNLKHLYLYSQVSIVYVPQEESVSLQQMKTITER